MNSKTILLLFVAILLMHSAGAQLPVETPEQKTERMAWWTADRFGMFIHWGLYAMPYPAN